ncbi:MAG: sulfatase [Planctomycetota bacterium]
MKGRIFMAASITLLSACAATDATVASTGPPNVVIVFVDDLGYGDLGCYGSALCETPRLDALAREGVRFTDFYVAQPVCSASRTALLTGCYPNRLGIHGALGPSNTHGIADGETTLAEVLRGEGYRTAIFGKWHLGHHAPFLPTRHGFDEYYGIPYSNDMWPYHPENPEAWTDLPTIEGEEIVGYNTDQSRFTTDFTRRAVDFIRRSAASGERFFCYLAHPMPHVPLFVSEERAGASGRGLYADVIAEIDWSVGRVLDALSESGVADDTLVIFASDNGPWLSYGDHAGSAGPLREGKGTTFEGGVRVPFIARWPNRIPAGAVQGEPCMTIDVLPTIAGLVGAPLPGLPIDGRDAWPLFACEPQATSPHEAYYFYYGRSVFEGLRAGRWKLHVPHGYRTMTGREPGRGGIPGKYDYSVKTGLELYDLEADTGESEDVASEHPEVLERLLRLAEAHQAELAAGAREPGRVK